MYSVIVNNKVLDFRFKKFELGWNFYIGEIFIGQIFSDKRRGYSAVSFHTVCPYGVVSGFKTRHHACEFMLKICGFSK